MAGPQRAIPENIRTLVNLERYPIHDVGGAQLSDLLGKWRQQLSDTGICNLDGFLSSAGARALAAESEQLMTQAYRRQFHVNFLYKPTLDESLPSDHPAKKFWTTTSSHLASDQFGPDSLLRQLYEWQPLTNLVAAVQGETQLFRDADEFQALNVITLSDGERTIYHHDQCDCAVTLLLQAPHSGGEFVYRTNTRNSDGSFDLHAIAQVVSEQPNGVTTVPRSDGTLSLFRGGRSLHGVTPVRGTRQRISAILSYDRTPDRQASVESNSRLYGPRVQKIYSARGL